MAKIAATALVLSALVSGAVAAPAKLTVVLGHGAFADSSIWNGVIAALQTKGYPVVSATSISEAYVGNKHAGISRIRYATIF